ncbi:MAG: hypothetical protein ACOYXA_12045 [Bacteroidota bacterium]
MKYAILLAGLTLFAAPTRAQDAATATDYLTSINNEFNSLSRDLMSYISAANHGKSARKVEKRRNELVLQTQESERAIRRLRPFNGNYQLRDSIARYFQICRIVINEDYGKIVNMEEIAEQSYDDMEAYLLAKEKASEKIGAAYDAADREYHAFAAANNIRIVEGDSKLGQRLKEAATVNDYHSKIYLLFFKSYKNEAYLLDAMSKESVGAIEQNRNALKASATHDQVTLGKILPFKGDGSLKKVTQDILAFYEAEGGTQTEKIIDFYLAKENFEKVKKNFEAISPAKRTQQDIDQYNQAINDYNKKVAESNRVHEELNKKRSALLKNWNTASQNFLDKYTPR